MEGKIVLVEGYKGSGKTTLIESLERKLQEEGIEYIVAQEPGGTGLGADLRKMILNTQGLDEYTRLCLFLASRRTLYRQVILPALKRGLWVICDRGYISTFSNQLVSEEFSLLDEYGLKDFCLTANFDLKPDLLFYLDTSLDTCIDTRVAENTGEVHYNGRSIDDHVKVYNRLVEEVIEAQRSGIETVYLPYRNGIEANSLVCLSAIKNLIKD